VCCSVLQHVTVCCRVLQCVAVSCNTGALDWQTQVAVCCSVLQCVACCVALCCSLLRVCCSRSSWKSRLQRIATYCNTNCNTLQHTVCMLTPPVEVEIFYLDHVFATDCNRLQQTATHCNTLQHHTTQDKTLQHTTTHCNTLQHTATHLVSSNDEAKCIAPQNAAHCNTLQHTATHFLGDKDEAKCTAHQNSTHCNTLQHTVTHTATHCNTLTWRRRRGQMYRARGSRQECRSEDLLFEFPRWNLPFW